MKINWTPVTQVLARYRAEGIALPIWWRDDDAIADTPELEMLRNIGKALNVPVHLSIIPGRVDPSLPPVLETHDHLIPLVHGWRHVRHDAGASKNTEFGVRRPGDTEELQAGLGRMKELFGSRLVPLFVPPWNHIDPKLLPELARLGYTGVSTYGARERREALAGLVQINTHVDPIDWRGTRGLIKPARLVSHIADILTARLYGRQDPAEPLGFLTHHLVHDRDIWMFTQDFLTRLVDAGATPVRLGTTTEDLP